MLMNNGHYHQLFQLSSVYHLMLVRMLQKLSVVVLFLYLKGQTEAAYSIGMNYRQTIQRIILPQAIRVSIPALGNTFLSLIKDTSLLGFILVAEMFRKAQEVASTTYEYFTIYILVAVMYWVIASLSQLSKASMNHILKRYNS